MGYQIDDRIVLLNGRHGKILNTRLALAQSYKGTFPQLITYYTVLLEDNHVEDFAENEIPGLEQNTAAINPALISPTIVNNYYCACPKEEPEEPKKPCSYCEGPLYLMSGDNMSFLVIANEVQKLMVFKNGLYEFQVDIEYCPKCGRKLK